MNIALSETDRLQRIVARLIAVSPAGVNLLLIGGFRYRLLDQSPRLSVDIDYHWGGDLDAKQAELLALCRRVVLGQVRREFGYEGAVSPARGPDADSPNARIIDLRFWKHDLAIEFPLEITQIICLDAPTIRTASGIVHATASDIDLVESKVISVVNRVFLQHRDLFDLFLYGEKLAPDSPTRVAKKLSRLKIPAASISRKLQDLEQNEKYHAGAIQKVIDEQIEPPVAEQLNQAGGGTTVLHSALKLLKQICP